MYKYVKLSPLMFTMTWFLVMDGMSGLFYNSVKTIMFVSGVVNSSKGTISFSEGVSSFNLVSIADFVLRLLVTSVRIMYSVAEFVFVVNIVIGSVGCFVFMVVDWSSMFFLMVGDSMYYMDWMDDFGFIFGYGFLFVVMDWNMLFYMGNMYDMMGWNDYFG